MENVKGVEGFMSSFIAWYSHFLCEVKKFGLDVPGTVAFNSRISMDRHHMVFMSGVGECGYQVRDRTQVGIGPEFVAKGTFDSLVAKEYELATKVRALAGEHKLPVPAVYFKYLSAVGRETPQGFMCLPQYDVFAYAMEFAVGNTCHSKVALKLLFDDSSGSFDPCFALRKGVTLYADPSPKVPGIRDEGKCNSSYRCFEHPSGNGAGYLEYDVTGEYDGNFFHAGNHAFGFNVAQHFLGDVAPFCLFEGVNIGEKVLGTGALTAFLEMLEETPADDCDELCSIQTYTSQPSTS